MLIFQKLDHVEKNVKRVKNQCNDPQSRNFNFVKKELLFSVISFEDIL